MDEGARLLKAVFPNPREGGGVHSCGNFGLSGKLNVVAMLDMETLREE